MRERIAGLHRWGTQGKCHFCVDDAQWRAQFVGGVRRELEFSAERLLDGL